MSRKKKGGAGRHVIQPSQATRRKRIRKYGGTFFFVSSETAGPALRSYTRSYTNIRVVSSYQTQNMNFEVFYF